MHLSVRGGVLYVVSLIKKIIVAPYKSIQGI